LPREHGTRFTQVQRNLPGELQRSNEVYAKHKVNIAAQYYQTDGEIGYVVLNCDDLCPVPATSWPNCARCRARSARACSTAKTELSAPNGAQLREAAARFHHDTGPC
jgi:hypothetical protein